LLNPYYGYSFMLDYHCKGVVRSLLLLRSLGSKRGVKDPMTVAIECEGWKGQMRGERGNGRPRALKGQGVCREMANRKPCDRAGKARWCQFCGGT